jgi:hypothetical protein
MPRDLPEINHSEIISRKYNQPRRTEIVVDERMSKIASTLDRLNH